jgi:asparagine synthase (glutamine-hydrolysing)
MCGIAGIHADLSRERIGTHIARMERALVHRGPDDGGIEIIKTHAGALALGARRLAVQDLSPSGHQPMLDESTGNCIVFNGEIYNFGELRSRLEVKGARFRSNCDTEVILRAYATWGPAMVHELVGMFAFAIWDQSRQVLLLARDRLGVKPLYYAVRGDTLVFASEARALLASGLVERRISKQGVTGYLKFGGSQDPFTQFEGVYALPAGQVGRWAAGALDLEEYWSLGHCFQSHPEIPTRDVPALVRARLEDSIRSRLISDAPIGVFLSGGIDSVVVTTLAAQQATSQVRTISVVFEETGYSEKPYIDLVARRLGTDHTEVCLTHRNLRDMIPDAISAMDQPSFDGINTYVVSRAARDAGLTVALSGIGGDELFGGYASFRYSPMLQRLRRWLPLPLAPAASAAIRLVLRDSDRTRKLDRWIRNATGRMGASILLRELFAPNETANLVPDAMPAEEKSVLGMRDLDEFNAVSLGELSTYLKNILLRDTDAMSMAHSLEVREPLLDHRLVELIASLPGSAKLRGNTPKPLLTAAMGRDLPEEIVRRRKMGFTLPFADWMRHQLYTLVRDTLLDRDMGGQLTEVLDGDAVAQTWRDFCEGRTSWHRPWSLFVLRHWGERWVSAQQSALETHTL